MRRQSIPREWVERTGEPMLPITICPHCGQKYELQSQEAVGKRAQCQKCKNGFVVAAAGRFPSPDKSPSEWPVPSPIAIASPTVIATGYATPENRARPDRTHSQRIDVIVVYMLTGLLVGSVLGYFGAHYFPIYGGFFAAIAEPHSRMRSSLVPGHMLFFALLFGGIGMAAGFTIRSRVVGLSPRQFKTAHTTGVFALAVSLLLTLVLVSIQVVDAIQDQRDPRSRAIRAAAESFPSMHDPTVAGYKSVEVTEENGYWIVDGIYHFNWDDEIQLTVKVRKSDYRVAEVGLQKDLHDWLNQFRTP